MLSRGIKRTVLTQPFPVPARRGEVQEHELDGEAVLFDPASGRAFHLNETALAVWRQCDGQSTAADIAAQLSRLYDVRLDVAEDHVEQLLVSFGESQLLAVEAIP
jgi:PqqD family protein of HPr-rel-A system